MLQIWKMVVVERGPAALMSGVVPRMLLSCYQTLFMVTGAKLIQQHFEKK